MDERPENTAESKPRKPWNSFPKRSILDSQLSWTHCLLLFEYLGVRGRLLVSMPGLIKWDWSFLADRWSGCHTQTSDRLLALGMAACRCSTRSLSLTAWAGDSFGWSGWCSTQSQFCARRYLEGWRLENGEMAAPVMSPYSRLLHHLMSSIYHMNQELISQGPILWDQVRQ